MQLLGTLWIQYAFQAEMKWELLWAPPHSAPCQPGVPESPTPLWSLLLLGRDAPPEDVDDGKCSQGKQLPAQQDEGPKEGAEFSGT